VASLWGIDLGGTKIEGVVLPDETSTDVRCRLRIATEADQGYDHILDRIGELVTLMEAQVGETCDTIGIGTPGAEEPSTGFMKNCNTTVLNGKPLPADLSRKLSKKVIVANDANCFALAEARLGAAKGLQNVFGVIMGTGVGGGVVIRGHLVNGAQGIAGEWGHNLLEPGGEPCYCGKIGCVETVLAGPWLEKFYEKRSGERRRLPEIVDRARAGDDPAAKETLDRLCRKFGEALSVVVDILDPDAIVLGGGVGNIREIYTRGKAELEKWIFNPYPRSNLLKPSLGDSAGVFGAAHLGLPG